MDKSKPSKGAVTEFYRILRPELERIVKEGRRISEGDRRKDKTDE